jgi:DNA-binding beta-propeller fold protein YncE
MFRAFGNLPRPTGDGASTGTSYRLAGRYNLGGDGGWDYISIDSVARRLYVSHGTELEVVDADTGKVVGQIPDTPGVHGAAIAPELKRGFTSNGRDKSVTVFDTETLKPIKKTSANGTDFILYDPFTKRVFPMSEKVTVLDAQTGDQVGELDLGGSPEAGVSDAKGMTYVNLVDKKAIAAVDAKALTVTKTYPIENCTSPHSLSYDGANQRLFVGCRDGLAVLDATTGKVVGRSMICSGVDAGGFDPENKLIFESCGEGVISVIQQLSPDYYQLVDTVRTQLYAKTMAFDPKTKKMFLPTAEFETVPNTDPKVPFPFKMQIRPGTFTVLVVSK